MKTKEQYIKENVIGVNQEALKKHFDFLPSILKAMDEYAKQESAKLLKACKKMKKELSKAVPIGGDSKYLKLLDAWQDITNAIKKATP